MATSTIKAHSGWKQVLAPVSITDVTTFTGTFSESLSGYNSFAIGVYTSTDGWNFREYPISFADDSTNMSGSWSLGNDLNYFVGYLNTKVSLTTIRGMGRVSSGNQSRNPQICVYGIR